MPVIPCDGPADPADAHGNATTTAIGAIGQADLIGIDLIHGPKCHRRYVGHHDIGPCLERMLAPERMESTHRGRGRDVGDRKSILRTATRFKVSSTVPPFACSRGVAG